MARCSVPGDTIHYVPLAPSCRWLLIVVCTENTLSSTPTNLQTGSRPSASLVKDQWKEAPSCVLVLSVAPQT